MGFRLRFEPSKKKPGRFSKRMVLFCIAAMMTYTVFCLWMQLDRNIQPESTLTTMFFGALFGELWELSKIKRKKQDNTESDSEE